MNTTAKYTLGIIIIILLYIIMSQLHSIIEQKEKLPTSKDLIMVYELCNKKSGPKTNFILSAYGEEESELKSYLLNKYE